MNLNDKLMNKTIQNNYPQFKIVDMCSNRFKYDSIGYGFTDNDNIFRLTPINYLFA